MVDEDGVKHTLNVGYIGFVPPQVMVWDKAHLDGKVEARDIVKTAEKYVPIVKKAGADLIVALAHTGPSDEPYFETSPSDKAKAFIVEKAQYPMSFVGTDETGFAIYQIDLTK